MTILRKQFIKKSKNSGQLQNSGHFAAGRASPLNWSFTVPWANWDWWYLTCLHTTYIAITQSCHDGRVEKVHQSILSIFQTLITTALVFFGWNQAFLPHTVKKVRWLLWSALKRAWLKCRVPANNKVYSKHGGKATAVKKSWLNFFHILWWYTATHTSSRSTSTISRSSNGWSEVYWVRRVAIKSPLCPLKPFLPSVATLDGGEEE